MQSVDGLPLIVGVLRAKTVDTGTHSSLLDASHFVETVQTRQGYLIGCLEEIAFHNGWLSKDEVSAAGKALGKTDYGQYLLSLVEG